MRDIIFEKEYVGESLFDYKRDIYKCLQETYLPVDEHGFWLGRLKITIEWCEND